MPVLGIAVGWHGVPIGVVGKFDWGDAGAALPCVAAGADAGAVELGAPVEGFIAGELPGAAPGELAPELLLAPAFGVPVPGEFPLAGHGTIGPGFGDALFCCVPFGGAVAVGGLGVCVAFGPAAFVVIGVGGPIVVGGIVVVVGWVVVLAGGVVWAPVGGAVCVGTGAVLGAGEGVAGVVGGGAVVVRCPKAQVALHKLHNRIARIAIRFVIMLLLRNRKIGSLLKNLQPQNPRGGGEPDPLGGGVMSTLNCLAVRTRGPGRARGRFR